MIRALVLLVLLGLVGWFAALNWGAFSAPTTLSLGFTSFQAPIGQVMLGIIAVLAVLFAAWALSLQATVLRETRRQSRELQAQRELADKAEASRFTELRGFLADGLGSLAQASDRARGEIVARVEQLELRSRQSLEQTTNTLAACIGEVEDRLDRGTAAGGNGDARIVR